MATHEGWKNYETWAVALWINNDEPLYNESRTMARQAMRTAKGGSSDKAPTKAQAREADILLADLLKDWITDMKPELGASLWSDLLSAALSEVDWLEIAHDFQGD